MGSDERRDIDGGLLSPAALSRKSGVPGRDSFGKRIDDRGLDTRLVFVNLGCLLLARRVISLRRKIWSLLE